MSPFSNIKTERKKNTNKHNVLKRREAKLNKLCCFTSGSLCKYTEEEEWRLALIRWTREQHKARTVLSPLSLLLWFGKVSADIFCSLPHSEARKQLIGQRPLWLNSIGSHYIVQTVITSCRRVVGCNLKPDIFLKTILSSCWWEEPQKCRQTGEQMD